MQGRRTAGKHLCFLLWKMGGGGIGIHLVYFGSQTRPEPKIKQGASVLNPPHIYPINPKLHSAI